MLLVTMQVKFIGATDTVSGSKHIIVLKNGFTILLDCGFYQGLGQETFYLNSKLEFDPLSINIVLLSHAHIDHCGNLPLLVKQGFKYSIFCTKATADMARLLLTDSFHIYESDIEKENQYRESKGLRPLKLLYDKEDLIRTFSLFKLIDFNETQKINDSCSFVFTPNGHILGSCSITLTIKEDKKQKVLTYTGDIGRYNNLIMKNPESFPQSDFLICESTYGDKFHEDSEFTKMQLLNHIKKTCFDKKGKLIIAAFSLGRTQEILFVLNQMKKLNLIPKKLKVFLDSPLSIKITNVSKNYFQLFNDDFKHVLKDDQDPFSFYNLFLLEKTEQSKYLNEFHEPCIIISASGMMDAGRIKHHLLHLLSDSKNTILASGFCTKNSLGDKLLSGVSSIQLFDIDIEVKADIEKIYSFSAHADSKEMLTYLSSQNKKQIKKIFLVHGEKESKIAWQKVLIKNDFKNIVIPEKNQIFEI
jgi:metallo-beta-lactamase family protein